MSNVNQRSRKEKEMREREREKMLPFLCSLNMITIVLCNTSAAIRWR
jgi:hypothetical protein